MNGFSRYDVLYDAHNKATAEEEISLFLTNPLWIELNEFIKKECGAKPELSYNLYASERRWNVEYHMNEKLVCTLFPEKNIFTAMIDVGAQEEKTVEEMLSGFTGYVQQLFQNTCRTPLGRWLAVQVTDRKILHDTEALVKVRLQA